MSKQPSTSIKIAALFFLVGGFLSILGTGVNLVVSITQIGMTRNATALLVLLPTLGLGIINFLIGWYLIKQKKWAYLLGIGLTMFSTAICLFAFFEAGTTQLYHLALSIALLGLLFHGRKDFKKA